VRAVGSDQRTSARQSKDELAPQQLVLRHRGGPLPCAELGCFTGRVMSDPPPPDTGSWPPPADGHIGVSAGERNWAMAAHIGSLAAAWFALGLIAPLLVLLIKGDSSPYIRRHAVESLNFQINALIYIVACVVLMFVLIGFVLIVVYGIFYLVCVITATVRASNGAEYRYPLTLRLMS
jgi:uncharacterized Tic20 family protein